MSFVSRTVGNQEQLGLGAVSLEYEDFVQQAVLNPAVKEAY